MDDGGWVGRAARIALQYQQMSLERGRPLGTTVRRQETAHLCCGIAILDTTCPVADEAAFTSPSVPAEKRNDPSGLNDRLRQLPLWRRVRQAVSIVPRPDSEMGLPSGVVRGGRP